ncbi:hypothetical protein Sps_01441 [Shewanella psychrophila]|uniref:Uncharacterized protein n=1 Tax=Shewanella psychrophila TaxID=225848 RepID=A0A1S6HM57_9GAMM|nr:hypothetical protein [Shewanella psychrophila]AQS36607.1 hypothetical protein Sps_01441 [Shewanella psychrophila]
MLKKQYTEIEKSRLIDLPQFPAGLLIQWLSTKPSWMQQRVMKQLTLKH